MLPEILEPIGRHLGVSNRVNDIFVAHVVPQRPGILPIVGELVAGGMLEHFAFPKPPRKESDPPWPYGEPCILAWG